MKKMITVAAFMALMVWGAPCVPAAEGTNEKATQAPKSEHKQKQIPFHGKVSAIDKTAKTISLEGKEKSRTFQITSETRITKDGKPAMLDALTVGEMVSGSYKENSAGRMEVASLNVGSKPGNPKHREKKGEKQ